MGRVSSDLCHQLVFYLWSSHCLERDLDGKISKIPLGVLKYCGCTEYTLIFVFNWNLQNELPHVARLLWPSYGRMRLCGAKLLSSFQFLILLLLALSLSLWVHILAVFGHPVS